MMARRVRMANDDSKKPVSIRVNEENYNYASGICTFLGKSISDIFDEALSEFVTKYKDAIDVEKLKTIK